VRDKGSARSRKVGAVPCPTRQWPRCTSRIEKHDNKQIDPHALRKFRSSDHAIEDPVLGMKEANSWKHFGQGAGFLRSSKKSVWPLCEEDPSHAHNVQVAARDIFATRDRLKSRKLRKILSPVSNICAITFKLCAISRLTAVEKHLILKSRAVPKAP
jgi:hypothetical protein